MKLCIDSDFIINFLKGKEEALDRQNLLGEFELCTTALNFYEVGYGMEKHGKNLDPLYDLKMISIDHKVVEKAIEIRIDLESEGTSLAHFDLLIGAACLVHQMPLLTFNQSHFSRLERFGLTLI